MQKLCHTGGHKIVATTCNEHDWRFYLADFRSAVHVDFEEELFYHFELLQKGKHNVCHIVDARESALDNNSLENVFNVFCIELADQVNGDCPTERTTHQKYLFLVDFLAIRDIVADCLCIKVQTLLRWLASAPCVASISHC